MIKLLSGKNTLSETKVKNKHVRLAVMKNSSLKTSRSEKFFNFSYFFIIAVLKNFAIFKEKHPCWSLFLIELQPWRPEACSFIKKETLAQYFPVNFMKCLGTPILKNICERLLLVVGWRITYKLSRRNLLLLTCLVYITIYVTSSFSSFIYGFLIHMCFGFDETELSYKGKIIWRTSAGSKI